MARVLDYQPQVQVSSKVDSELDLRHIGGLDGINRESAERAGRRVAVLGHASLALEHGEHDGRGIGGVQVGRSPVGHDGLAFGGVVDARIGVAGGTNRDGLDEGAAGQEVKDLPGGTVGPEKVIRRGLAARAGKKSALLDLGGAIVFGESKEGDVGEVVVSKVGDDIVGQDKGLGGV